MRKIIHVDMDAFYASVEQRDDPALRGRPVVVAWKGARSVVCAASYEARTFGIRSAMPAVRAERLCPEAVFVPPDFTRYRAVSQQVREIFARHTPLIEPLSLDEAYLDVTDHLAALGSATAVAECIRAQIRDELNLTASAGVAPNKFLAKIASDVNKPDGLCVVKPRDVDCFLLPLPVARLPGVGKVTGDKLAALGVTSVAELRGLERAALEARFGRWGGRLHDLALGIDDHPVRNDRQRRSISAEDTFADDLPADALAPHIRRMADKTWAAAAKRDLRGRTVVLKLKTADFRIISRHVTPPQPPISFEQFTALAIGLLSRVEHPPGQRYRLVGVGLDGVESGDSGVASSQADLFLAGGDRS
ncbi:DNA polymerase IV [Polycyclovorans algicola]|uniref:DNA polymerase IV n=1 Tax=Polycyclovorans algicola TaxID=616992 RepID=UPI0004A70F3F|nr:DNA polymerase IV [Polycyclovorans algicola]